MTATERAALAAWDRAVTHEREYRLAQASSAPLYVFTRIAKERTRVWAELASLRMVTPYEVAQGR